MKLLIDTNILLDVFCARAEFLEDSKKVFYLCETNEADGYISALSIANMFYVLRKELNGETRKNLIDKLKLIFKVTDLQCDDLTKATELDFKDFEDGLQSSVAMRIKANYIITRNVKDFASSKIKALTPTEFFRLYQTKY